MYKHVRFGQQGFKMRPVVRLVQIETRASLAKRHLGFDAVLSPFRRIDPEHAGTEARKETRGDRPCQDASQVEDSQAREVSRECGQSGP